jgi:hypothetical protein
MMGGYGAVIVFIAAPATTSAALWGVVMWKRWGHNAACLEVGRLLDDDGGAIAKVNKAMAEIGKGIKLGETLAMTVLAYRWKRWQRSRCTGVKQWVGTRRIARGLPTIPTPEWGERTLEDAMTTQASGGIIIWPD